MGADAFPYCKSHSSPGYGVSSSQISLLAKLASLIHRVYFLLLDSYCLGSSYFFFLKWYVLSSLWNSSFPRLISTVDFAPITPFLTDHTFPWTLALILSVPNHINFGSCVHGCWFTSAEDNTKERKSVREKRGEVKQVAKLDCTCSHEGGEVDGYRKINRISETTHIATQLYMSVTYVSINNFRIKPFEHLLIYSQGRKWFVMS